MTLPEIIDNAASNSEFIPGMSSNELFFGTSTNDRLTDVIADVAEACMGKADSDHEHSDYAAAEHSHTGYAAADHSHTGYAVSTHGHTPASIGAAAASHSHDYAASNHGHSYNDLSDKPTIPSIPASLPADGGNADTVDGKHASDFALASHNHSGYAASGHTHTASQVGAAAAAHTHTAAAVGAAPASHTHSEYAASNHGHSDYMSKSGGTIEGDLNVNGVLKVNGQQAIYYAASTASQTIGTGNATGGTTIACGSSANVNINGANVKMPNALPKTSNTYYCGNSTLRWKGIYSNSEVNVASDKRLKRDIATMDDAALAAFIEKLNVVSFNYNEDPAEAKSRIGLIAQDVQDADAALAKFFVEEDEEGMLGMTPADLVFPLIAAVQQLSKRVAELEGK